MREYKIRFRTPDTSWTAIVRGAVVCGIDNAQIPSIRRARASPYSYGVSLDESFQDGFHPPEDLKQFSPKGKKFAQAQLIWLVNEGDVVFANETRKVKKEFTVSFSKAGNSIDLPIYRHSCATDEDSTDRPNRMNIAKSGKLTRTLLICSNSLTCGRRV